MRRSFAFAALVAATALVAGGDACAPHDDAPLVGIGPTLVVPHGLLQSLAKLTVREWPANPVSCDPPSGVVTNPRNAQPEVSAALSQNGCTNGSVWCGSMQIPSSGAPRVFGAEGRDGTGAVVLVGCTQVVVSQQSQPIPIVMRRSIGMPVCGDMTIDPTEQCDPPDPPNGLVCDANCQSQEELITVAQNGGPGPESQGTAQFPALLWPAAAAPAGRFAAYWQDKSMGSSYHVGLRVLGDDLDTLPQKGNPPALTKGSIWLQTDPTGAGFPTGPDPNNQTLPAVDYDASTKRTYVAFADNSGGAPDIKLRTLEESYDPDTAQPVVMTGFNGSGEPNLSHTSPSIALGAGGKLYVVWQASATAGQPGAIVGRTFTYPNTYGSQVTLASSGSASPRVAAQSNGWVVVWQDASSIQMLSVDANGKPVGSATNVSAGHGGTQAHPSVAVIGGGDDSFAVAWADSGSGTANVVVQRYDAMGNAVAGDSMNVVNSNTMADQTQPVIGASSTNAFYVVAWIDTMSGHVRARFLDEALGYDFNNVSGQNDDFQVSITEGRTRSNPAVAVGGNPSSGPFVAIGWEDDSTSGSGIYVRRFPLAP